MKSKRLKIAVLSRNTRLYSTKRLVEAGLKRGHDLYVIDPLRCYMNISVHNPEIHYKGRKLENFDAVIPRIGQSVTFYATAVLRQFEMIGVFSLNESVAISRARDKLRSLQLLARKGIGMPVTGFAHSPDDTDDLLAIVGDVPLIIKLTEGSQGQGVVLAETRHAAESVIDAFRGLDAHFLVQQFIKESRGTDIRCFVIGNKVVASMKRLARKGEFRANLHRGGKAEAISITPAEREMAVKAAKIMGLNVAGVDLIRSTKGSLVLEVNSSPGLEGIEAATQKNIAGEIIAFVERHARTGYTRTKGSG
ncbi:MAG: 30S ribosomal protein S6--L-glutamate ligase [Gammaproteobacteria bacterium]